MRPPVSGPVSDALTHFVIRNIFRRCICALLGTAAHVAELHTACGQLCVLQRLGLAVFVVATGLYGRRLLLRPRIGSRQRTCPAKVDRRHQYGREYLLAIYF
jgi:hypothetical protein